MVEYLDWIFRIGIIGIAVWAVKGYLSERTIRRRAGEQFMTMDEITRQCEKRHSEIRKEVSDQIQHVADLIAKDLVHGAARFERIEQTLKQHEACLHSVDKKIDRLLNGYGVGRKPE